MGQSKTCSPAGQTCKTRFEFPRTPATGKAGYTSGSRRGVCKQTTRAKMEAEVARPTQVLPSSAPTTESNAVHTLREEGGVTDELDNQVITNGEHPPKVSENLQKRKLIGDEFYREDEKIVKLHSIIVNPNKLAAELAAQLSNSQPVSNKTPTIVSTESFLTEVEESRQKFQEHIISEPVLSRNQTPVEPVGELTPNHSPLEAKYISPLHSPHNPDNHTPPPFHLQSDSLSLNPQTIIVPPPSSQLKSDASSAPLQNGLASSNLFQEDLNGQHQPEEPMVVSYNGHVSDYPTISCHMMTATTESVLDSVLVNSLVKNEPEDLTGQRHRHGSDISLDVGVTAKRLLGDSLDKQNMGLVTSPDGDSHIILNTEDLPLAPGFPSTTISSSGYDPPTFYTTSSDQGQTRLYDSSYRDQDLYPGEPGYNRNQNSYSIYSSGTPGLSVDLPSPDSGIGDQITPRGIVDSDSSFEYSTQHILDNNTIRKPWHDYGSRNSDTEKIQIPKAYSPYGFHYILDAPTSSSVRREDDKVTYINKGQFYGVTLDYQPDPEHAHLKSPTVKSVIMLVFRRDGKSQEEEIKAWRFWHQRQHSVKQRIIDVDTKNSLGLVGHIEELSHNALAVYWNPLDSPAKVNLAVQCLSTDFSTQKGVKGLPLHVQIDTYDDPRSEVGSPSTHRGYCQVKIFCDKGAERKLRDEERRANKRRMTPSGKRRLDEMYHESFDRTEFYSMSDLNKPPTLFSPPEDPEKSSQLNADFPGFYSPQRQIEAMKPMTNGDLLPCLMSGVGTPNHVVEPLRRGPEKTELQFLEKSRRHRLIPPVNERIMVYVRQETEDVYTPLHLVPPTVSGLINSIENKYKINASNIRYLYRKNKDGIIAKIDDDMLRLYCNEDVFLMQVMVTEGPGGEETMVYDITLSEIQSSMEH